MNRRHANTEPQQSLRAVVAFAFRTARRVSGEQFSKPAHREAPPSA